MHDQVNTFDMDLVLLVYLLKGGWGDIQALCVTFIVDYE